MCARVTHVIVPITERPFSHKSIRESRKIRHDRVRRNGQPQGAPGKGARDVEEPLESLCDGRAAKWYTKRYKKLALHSQLIFSLNAVRLMATLVDFKTMEDALKSPLVSRTDKNRLIQCYRKVKLMGDDWKFGNTNFMVYPDSVVYKVNSDKSIRYLKTVDLRTHHFIQIVS